MFPAPRGDACDSGGALAACEAAAPGRQGARRQARGEGPAGHARLQGGEAQPDAAGRSPARLRGLRGPLLAAGLRLAGRPRRVARLRRRCLPGGGGGDCWATPARSASPSSTPRTGSARSSVREWTSCRATPRWTFARDAGLGIDVSGHHLLRRPGVPGAAGTGALQRRGADRRADLRPGRHGQRQANVADWFRVRGMRYRAVMANSEAAGAAALRGRGLRRLHGRHLGAGRPRARS